MHHTRCLFPLIKFPFNSGLSRIWSIVQPSYCGNIWKTYYLVEYRSFDWEKCSWNGPKMTHFPPVIFFGILWHYHYIWWCFYAICRNYSSIETKTARNTNILKNYFSQLKLSPILNDLHEIYSFWVLKRTLHHNSIQKWKWIGKNCFFSQGFLLGVQTQTKFQRQWVLWLAFIHTINVQWCNRPNTHGINPSRTKRLFLDVLHQVNQVLIKITCICSIFPLKTKIMGDCGARNFNLPWNFLVSLQKQESLHSGNRRVLLSANKPGQQRTMPIFTRHAISGCVFSSFWSIFPCEPYFLGVIMSILSNIPLLTHNFFSELFAFSKSVRVVRV